MSLKVSDNDCDQNTDRVTVMDLGSCWQCEGRIVELMKRTISNRIKTLVSCRQNEKIEIEYIYKIYYIHR